MFQRPFSLKSQQLFMLLLAGTVPLVLLLFYADRFTAERAKAQAFERMEAILAIAKQQLEGQMNREIEEIRAVSSPSLFQREDGRTPKQVVEQLREIYALFNRGDSLFALFDQQGYPISSSKKAHLQYGNTKAFQVAANAGKPAASEAHMLLASKDLVIGLYHPIRNHMGEVANVVRHYVPIHQLMPEMEVEGTLIWLNKDNEVLYGKALQPLDKIDTHYRGTEQDSGFCFDANSRRSLYVKTRLENEDILQGGTLLYLLPERTALASMRDYHSMALIAGISSFAILALLSIVMSARLSRPIRAAASAVAQVADGAFDITLKMEGPRELQQLSGALNSMSNEVRKRRQYLEEQIQARTKSLSEMSAFTHAIMDSLDQPLVVFDASGSSLRFVNLAAKKWFNLDEKASLRVWHNELNGWFDEESNWLGFWGTLSKSDRTRSKQFPVHHETMSTINITSAPVHGSDSAAIGRLWLFRDVSERERLEAELRQSQKIEAVGTLAGGLAHDFNNILTAIQGGLELVLIDLEEGIDPRQSLDVSLTGCNRAASVVQQLLSFSRQRPLELKTLTLKEVVKDTITLARPSIDRLIDIKTTIPIDPVLVSGDRVQIEQVLMNLVINASHAMPDGGHILIRCFNTIIKEADPLHPDRYTGVFSCIEVKDSGHGMTEEVKNRIFDPFFTTKPQGKGTGLGLATSVGIVQRHKGWMTCETAPGRGTTFTIVLPAAEAAEADVTEPAPIPIHAALSARILLVDDEAPIRKIAKTILKRATHQVEEVSDGLEALKYLETRTVDLVLLDLTMPYLSGAETLRRIKQKWPKLPVLIWSGHSEDAPGLFDREFPPEAFLVKPFRKNELLQAVGNVLQKSRPAQPTTDRHQA